MLFEVLHFTLTKDTVTIIWRGNETDPWDQVYIYMIQQAYKYVSLSLFNAFQAENHLHVEIICEGNGKEWVAMGTKCFIAVGVFSVELLACQVSMVSSVSHLHILHTFQT